MALSRQAFRLSRALPQVLPSVRTQAAPRRGGSNIAPRSLRLFNQDQDSDFFPNPASFLLGGLTPSLLTSALAPAASPARQIALDVIEKPEEFEVKADLPGIKEEDVKVTIDGDVLSLSVEGQDEQERDEEQNGVKIHRIERSHLFVRRAIRLPESADTENIAADLHDGVLNISIPKREKAEKQKRIAVAKGNGAKANGDGSKDSETKKKHEEGASK